MSSSVKRDSAIMFGFIFCLVVIFKGVLVITSAQSCSQSQLDRYTCKDDFVEVNYPFWHDIGSDYHCGYPGFGIKCAEGETISVMNISNQLYHLNIINYERSFVRVKVLDIDGKGCLHPRQNFSLQEFRLSLTQRYEEFNWLIFYNCSNREDLNETYVKDYHMGCLDNSGRRSYAFPPNFDIPNGFNWYGNCEQTLLAPFTNGRNYSDDAKLGINLFWSAPSVDCRDCENSDGLCSYNENGDFRKCSCGSDFSKEFDKICPPRNKGLSIGVKVLIGVFTGVGVLLLLVLLTYNRVFLSLYKVTSHWRNKINGQTNVEMFLENYGHLTIQRYKYSEIKKMTNSFEETLGQGGYGSVFKGKLKRDGRLVAVKLLNESKGKGEDFINEVATISSTNHVNVVNLLGFCTEGTKRALIYEFMPNGSLERFIYNEKTSSTPLGCEKLYQIALGIATGLDYLHRGCNTRILHFDIKPHNILLDEEFIPKISDFGLAKLCPTRESVVSMPVARGTIGYIAPEVFCRNFGRVSHKSDVYSYGMMVLEMVGGRKNINATAENTSEIYFPQWIYNNLKQDIDVEGSREIFEDETTKKLIIVALWCIQTQPADRPSINKVVEMLERNIEDLQIPPNPFQDHPSRSSP